MLKLKTFPFSTSKVSKLIVIYCYFKIGSKKVFWNGSREIVCKVHTCNCKNACKVNFFVLFYKDLFFTYV